MASDAQPRRRRRWPWWVVGAIVALFIIGAIGNAVAPTKKTHANTATSSATTTLTTTAPRTSRTSPAAASTSKASSAAHPPAAPKPAAAPAVTGGRIPCGQPGDVAMNNVAQPWVIADDWKNTADMLRTDARDYLTAVDQGNTQAIEVDDNPYSEIMMDTKIIAGGAFGCWDPLVLTSVEQSSKVVTDNLGNISMGTGDLAASKTQLNDYLQAVTAWASQFGGESVTTDG